MATAVVRRCGWLASVNERMLRMLINFRWREQALRFVLACCNFPVTGGQMNACSQWCYTGGRRDTERAEPAPRSGRRTSDSSSRALDLSGRALDLSGKALGLRSRALDSSGRAPAAARPAGRSRHGPSHICVPALLHSR